jgi:DNA-binding transcriptional ArsR family regulator
MNKISIDRKALFALASETRIELLKKLDAKRMTLTELSEELNVSKAAVKGHLDKLIEAGMIKKVDEGRKWIYYELTGKGRNILHPESRTKIYFLLSSALASITAGLFELYKFISSKPYLPTPVPTPIPAETPTPMPTKTPYVPTPEEIPVVIPTTPVPSITPEIHLLAATILILFSIVILYLIFKNYL